MTLTHLPLASCPLAVAPVLDYTPQHVGIESLVSGAGASTAAIPDPRPASTGLGGTSLHVPGTQLGTAFWKHLLSSEHRPGSLSNNLCTYLQRPKRNKVAGDDLKA